MQGERHTLDGGSPGAVWYLFPSANPANARRCSEAWRDMGYHVAILQDRTLIDAPCDALVSAAAYPGWAGSINRLFREAVPKSCRVIVAGGDDMFPDPNLRAGEIAAQFFERFPDTLGVMQPTGDAFEVTDEICGSPWVGRGWMEQCYSGRGGFCDAYHQQYADDEMYWVARCCGRLWQRLDLTHYHEHFRRTGAAAPAYWVESAAGHEEHDCLTFLARSRARFPGAVDGILGAAFDYGIFQQHDNGRAAARYRSFFGGGAEVSRAPDRMAAAFRTLAEEGVERVALYAAGQHTRRSGEALASPPVDVRFIIDDDPARVGTRLWNYEIVSIEDAVARRGEIQAVVLSSDSAEERLAERAAGLESQGVRVVRLYGQQAGVA